jgi:O-antigen/teichoic acid export membrane protein
MARLLTSLGLRLGWPSEDDHLLRGSVWAIAGLLTQAVSGLAFWFLAARLETPETIGLASAMFASVQFVNFATSMGLPEALSAFPGRDRSDADTLFTWAALTTTTSSAVGTAVYALAVSSDGVDRLLERGVLAGWLLFFVVSAGNAVALLVDVRFMSTRHWVMVFARSAVVGFARIPLLLIPAVIDEAVWVFLAMTGPIALSGFLGVGLAGLVTDYVPTIRHRLDQARQIVRYAWVNYLSHLGVLAPQFVLPVLVLVSVDADENANFYLAWTITAVVAIIPITIGRVLLVEGSRRDSNVRSQVRWALVLAVSLTGLATGGALVLRALLVVLYGEDYELASDIIPWLVAGCIPWSVTAIAMAVSRVHHDHPSVLALTGTLAISIIGTALVLVPASGAVGATQAWVLGNLVTVFVAALVLARGKRLTVIRDASTRNATSTAK